MKLENVLEKLCVSEKPFAREKNNNKNNKIIKQALPFAV
jgi:hypothetical protein